MNHNRITITITTLQHENYNQSKTNPLYSILQYRECDRNTHVKLPYKMKSWRGIYFGDLAI